ncbi:3'(2'),5'-bisphosphate nucleotidase [Bernardetia litoralis DSM 6794]|uniref:3'(2'),5'-bisphosphate nucleotidase CysQ n=1 Tax=Bernardetia litoralis (strain ATCC 23117 / DSM 6794 / NBRC 15988 / NCIMB 1366 / Fx l1 / Sio-4) TaxID=880071 RepID=I4AFX0_BERLS|nr:3'(2'),5'-bisphosphate nucleotidase CysQ [Bernardetia litoralis]AFM02855.1 3'(2'),5'-bisphosphate nucleotidase [Bernardetia litoralis DSM 6794]
MIEIAIIAAVKAGERIKEIYDKFDDENNTNYTTDNIVSYKSDNSPLTLADKEANKIIEKNLIPLGLPILSEEGKITPYSERKDWDKFWLVDPLDGTREFVKRNGNFTVNIALMENNIPVVGIIYVPVTGVLYVGELGKGTYKQELNQKNTIETAEKIIVKVSKRKNEEGIIAFKSQSHSGAKDNNYLSQFNVKEIRRKGSSVKFCLVAEGVADLYYRNGTTMEWDTAAGEAILKAAGGIMLNADTDTDLKYNKENLENPPFCAMNAAIFETFEKL